MHSDVQEVWVKLNPDAVAVSRITEKSEKPNSLNEKVGRRPLPVVSWGWLITLAAFTLHFFTYGTLFSFGAMFVPLRDTFNSSETSVGWVGSISQGLGGLLSPFAGLMFEFIGFRFTTFIGISLCAGSLVLSSFVTSIPYMFVTFGLLFGTGTALVFNTSVNAVAAYFQGRSAAASGIALCGMTVGTLTLNSFLGVLIINFGWRNMLRILAGALVITCFPSCLAFKEPSHDILAATKEMEADEDDLSKGRDVWKYVRIFMTVDMLLLFSAVTIYSIACAFHYINLISFMYSIGINESSGCLVVTILGAADGLGRLLSSVVGDRLPCSRLYTLVVACVVGAIPTFCLVFIETFGLMVVYAIILGISRGVIFTMQYPVALETFGVRRGVEALTNVILAMGLGTLLGSSVGGMSFDRTGSYETSFYICGGQLSFAATLVLILIYYRKVKERRGETRYVHQTINTNPYLKRSVLYTYVSVV
ncbi:monocarboxylate transporter 13-like [Anneissia japonica]|uniref:monocarboxylate transporter 13-like n=1 Tax=Anneissia japonica TaxID=1529436 RepID=UPI001425718B|nr:monocarboxylate transporter 13-like [Anneissia japonica]